MTSQPPNQATEPEPPTDRSYGIVTLRYAPSSTTTSTSTSQTPASSSSSSPPTAPNTKTSTLQVLLIHQKTLTGPPFWTFPKGHPEPSDKTILDTARRELLEETGLVVGKEDILYFPSESQFTSKETREGTIEGRIEGTTKDSTFLEHYRIPYTPKPSPSDPSNPSNPSLSSPPQPTNPQPTNPSQNSTFLEPYTSPHRTRGKIVTYYVAFLPSSPSSPKSSPTTSSTSHTSHATSSSPTTCSPTSPITKSSTSHATHTLTLQPQEVAAAKWLSLDEAMHTIRFPEGREVLRGVREAIERVGGVEGCGRLGVAEGKGLLSDGVGGKGRL